MKMIFKRFRGIDSVKDNHLSIFIIFILSLIPPITWFKDEYLIAGVDVFPLLNARYWINTFFSFVWYGDLGRPAYSNPSEIFPLFLLWAICLNLGIDPLTIQKLWLFLQFFISGLSIYYLFSILMPNKKYTIGKAIAPIFYMYNPHVFNCYIPAYAAAYAFAPLVLAIFARGLQKKEMKYAILVVMTSLGLTGSMPIYILTLLICGAYFIHFIIFLERKLIACFIFFAQTVMLWLLINLFWIISLTISIQSETTTVSGLTIDYVIFQSKISSFSNVLRPGPFAYVLFIEEYYPYAVSYSTPFLIITTFFIPILAFSALLFRPKNKVVLFTSILSVLSIFLAKGLHPPLETVNKFLYVHIPGFMIFRSAWKYFGFVTVLCFTILIGVAISEIFNHLRKRKLISTIFIILILSTIFINAWPLITGDIILSERGVYPSYHVKIPSYWPKAGEWINDQEGDFRIFELPQNTLFLHYKWGYHGVSRDAIYIHKPLLAVYPVGVGGFKSEQIEYLTYETYRVMNSTDKLWKPLGVMNVRYILQRNDLDWTYYNTTDVGSPEFIKNVLKHQEGVYLERSFGELDFYKIDDEYFVPHIYGASNIMLLNASKRSDHTLIDAVLSKEFIPKRTVIINSEDISSKDTSILKTQTNMSTVSFQKINPTKYKVHVSTSHPFFLVFSENYHPDWKAYIGNVNWVEALWKKPIPNDKHFLVNGYANAWYVDMIGDYDITLYFLSQSTYNIGLIVSGFTFITCIYYLTWHWIKRRLRR